MEVFAKFQIKAPETGNELTEPQAQKKERFSAERALSMCKESCFSSCFSASNVFARAFTASTLARQRVPMRVPTR